MEEPCYRSYGARFHNLEMVNARWLVENQTMYMGRSNLHLSWAPPPLETQIRPHNIQLRIGGIKKINRTKEIKRSSKTSLKLWWNNPEIKRRGRVARYKIYDAEGRVKKSLKKGYNWLKNKCLEIVRTI